MNPEWQVVAALGAAFVATPVLARLSLKTGFLTDSKGLGQEWRKPSSQAVALVGGAAVMIGLGATGVALPWAALALAFLMGTLDDAKPLGAGWKVFGQMGAGGLLAWQLGWQGWEIPLGVFAAVLAQNAMNTWDHADGLCAGLAGVALPPILAGPFLGFLPWNLLLLRREAGADQGSSAVPWAYLGDAGSHVAGILMLWYEPARPLLLLPVLDLVRVVWLRLRAGQPFWVGDRRHLGHRLQDAGLDPKLVAVTSLAPCLPLAAAESLGLPLAGLTCLGLLVGLLWYVSPAAEPGNGDGGESTE